MPPSNPSVGIHTYILVRFFSFFFVLGLCRKYQVLLASTLYMLPPYAHPPGAPHTLLNALDIFVIRAFTAFSSLRYICSFV